MFLTGKTVAIVTGDVMKMTTTYSAMIGRLFDIIIVAVGKVSPPELRCEIVASPPHLRK